MNIIGLSICLLCCGPLYAAAESSVFAKGYAETRSAGQVDDDSRATSGSGSETHDKDVLKTVIYRSNESTPFLAATAHVLPGARFNTQCIGTIYVDHERCCMLAIADDTIGQVDQQMHKKLDNMSSDAPIWNNMRHILTDITHPATHAAILLANKSSLYMHVKDTASKILVIWPDAVMELVAPIDRPTDDPVSMSLDSGLQGIVLLRNCMLTNESIRSLLADPSLQNVCAIDLVNAIMQRNVAEDGAVGYFDCKKWLGLLSVVPRTAEAAQQKKSKSLLYRLLRRKSRKAIT